MYPQNRSIVAFPVELYPPVVVWLYPSCLAIMAMTFRTQGYRLQKDGSPQTEYNKSLVRRLYTEVWGEKDRSKVSH